MFNISNKYRPRIIFCEITPDIAFHTYELNIKTYADPFVMVLDHILTLNLIIEIKYIAVGRDLLHLRLLIGVMSSMIELQAKYRGIFVLWWKD